MTDVTTSGQNVPAIFNFFDNSQFATMQKVSEMFANSELVPEMYRVGEKVTIQKAQANCMIALSLAQRINADALMVMQNLVIISGRPTWSSKFLISTVNTCGQYDKLKYKREDLGPIGKIKVAQIVYKMVPGQNGRQKVTEFVEQDYSHINNISVIAYATEKATGDVLESTPVTMLMAIQEGWYNKNGSKWQTMPEKMLKYRAASFWTNENAPEISMGMKTDDEMEDIVEDIEHEELSSKRPNVAQTVAANANKTEFSINNTEEVATAPKTEEPKAAEPVKPEVKKDKAEAKKPAEPAEDKKLDTLAQVGQELAAKEAENAKPEEPEKVAETPKTEEQKPAADAGVAPAFGQGLFK